MESTIQVNATEIAKTSSAMCLEDSLDMGLPRRHRRFRIAP